LPFYSRRAFRRACRLIKTGNRQGLVKRFLLSVLPPAILRRRYPIVRVERHADITTPSAGWHALIRPWAQRPWERAVLIHFDNNGQGRMVRKIAFSEEAAAAMRREHRALDRLGELRLPSSIHVPAVAARASWGPATVLDFPYLDGEYYFQEGERLHLLLSCLQGNGREATVATHPYIIRTRAEITRMPAAMRRSLGAFLTDRLQRFASRPLPVVFMHGDLGYPNLLDSPERLAVLDWENAAEDGIPIDLNYYRLKRRCLQGKNWRMRTMMDFFAMYQAVLLALRNGNGGELEFWRRWTEKNPDAPLDA